MSSEHASVGILLLELSVPESQSLKDKRRILLSLKDRLRGKFNVSVAEIGHLDKWQRSALGLSCISNDRKHVDSSLQICTNFVSEFHKVIILEAKMEIL